MHASTVYRRFKLIAWFQSICLNVLNYYEDFLWKTTQNFQLINYLRFKMNETAYKLQAMIEYNALMCMLSIWMYDSFRVYVYIELAFSQKSIPNMFVFSIRFFLFLFLNSFPNGISKHKNVSQFPTRLNRTVNVWKGKWACVCACVYEKRQGKINNMPTTK